MMAGVILVAMGLMRMGNLIKFPPRPLIIGFTNGIAVLIILSQVKEFFGLQIEAMPADFVHNLQAIYHAAPTVDIVTLLLAAALFNLPVETIGTRFGGIPATGAIARTAANVRSGATSPISGIVHALTLLVIVLIAAPLAVYIPLATLSAILLVVAINMGEWEGFRTLRKYPKSDSAVLVVTFLLTVVFGLTVAVEIGMFIAVFFFIKRITELTHVSISEHSPMPDDSEATLLRKAVPKGVVIYRVFGALFFGAADKLETILQQSHTEPDVLILKMHEVISMDASALHTLEHLYGKLRKHGKHLILCGPHTQPYFLMHQAGFFAKIGIENVAANLDDALARAKVLLS